MTLDSVWLPLRRDGKQKRRRARDRKIRRCAQPRNFFAQVVEPFSAATLPMDPPPPTSSNDSADLPENRFELELEFVQALASPAYLHFLATYREGNGPVLLQDPQFIEYLKYLRKTWTRPEYARFILYPHALFFLELLCGESNGGADVSTVAREWSQPGFRDFCHQQQFLAWQHRHRTLYGGGNVEASAATNEDGVAPSDAANS
ncbi:hypothetical protein MPSEU_000609800 [Mayamaea pseudoterrestris]|nr:hypothetical protein MPSEU_000609800 [Mayamaea pseudoterrestris]